MATRDRRDTPRNRGESPQQHQPSQQQQASAQKQTGGAATPPVWSRRYWTGAGNLEIAVFSRVVENGNGGSFTSFSTGVKRSFKDGDEYKETRFLRPEDLLVASHALEQAYAFIASEQERKD